MPSWGPGRGSALVVFPALVLLSLAAAARPTLGLDCASRFFPLPRWVGHPLGVPGAGGAASATAAAAAAAAAAKLELKLSRSAPVEASASASGCRQQA